MAKVAKPALPAQSSQTDAAVFEKPGKRIRGGDAGFGKEGTNKTQPVPQADAEPSAELLGTKSKYIPKSPYTRG